MAFPLTGNWDKFPKSVVLLFDFRKCVKNVAPFFTVKMVLNLALDHKAIELFLIFRKLLLRKDIVLGKSQFLIRIFFSVAVNEVCLL